jgi:hypothetical protein|mmetsp:Transcript_81607/g.128496  ORF Transcript_81607/g.128496 Transcript_81607/m.128496 type:complete len:282 (-) Transcript_81607:47-892(-)
MVKLPGKFDDVVKTAKSVLDDDYKSKGYQLEAKHKTKLDGAILTSSVDLDFAKKSEGGVTPAKISWKFPKPFGLVGFAIDKFEFDKEGKMKIETAMKKDMHKVDDLVIQATSDCKDASKATVSLTYTGIKDAYAKFETKPLKVDDFTAECLYGVGPAVVGAQFKGTDVSKASVGLNFTSGNFFASVIAKKMFSDFTAYAYFKPMSDVSLAATCNYGGKDVTWTVGGAGTVAGIPAKAKINNKLEANTTCKVTVCDGMKATLGASYGISDGKTSVGAKLVIE